MNEVTKATISGVSNILLGLGLIILAVSIVLWAVL